MPTHYNEDKLITCLTHNWFATPDGDHDETFTVGTRNVTAIKEHQAQGEGDKWFYDVFYADGTIIRLFNPNSVKFTIA